MRTNGHTGDGFDALLGRLAKARSESEAAADALATARARVARAELEASEAERRLDPQSREDAERLEGLRAKAAAASRAATAAHGDLVGLRRAERGILDEFAAFSDPRLGVGRLADDYPILLFPLRLETRFKEVARAGGGTQAQLWVRVYPDTCIVDAFEPELSETEVRSARSYWQAIWRAGRVEADERAAWRNLVASHGDGRAAWIVDHFAPENPGDAPVKAARTDVVLVVSGPPTLLPEADRNALTAYWTEVWRAGADKARQDAALAALEAAVGAARAGELIETQKPYNLDDEPQGGLGRDEVAVSVAWVILSSDVEAKPVSWTRPPRVTLLPDRLLLIARSGAQTLEVLGQPVHLPLTVGPDPLATGPDQLRPQNGELQLPEDLRWMVDFDRAVEWGLGFRVDLTAEQARSGFDRLLVLGVRMSLSSKDGKDALEELIDHHRNGSTGLTLLRQGTRTNNAEGEGAGFSREADADASFDERRDGAVFPETDDWLRKADGQWLAELLGLDLAAVAPVSGSRGTDQAEARAMNTALWPATLGYFLDTLMQPVLSDGATDATRTFFTRFVSGRGSIPVVRIGAQPYGILPTTAFSRVSWLDGERDRRTFRALGLSRPYLAALFAVLRRMDRDWGEMAAQVSFVGRPGDPHRTLLDILGLHPASAEYHYRYAETVDHLFNYSSLAGFGSSFYSSLARALFDLPAMALLSSLGYTGSEKPEILERFFLDEHDPLSGPVVDDRPFSEELEIRAWTPDGRNYLEWLIDAARTSLETLRSQAGFTDGRPPTALLYLFLRHALILGYADAGYELHRAADLPSATLAALKREPAFVHVSDAPESSESRWQPLYKLDPELTGSAVETVAEYLTANIDTSGETRRMREQLDALDVLKRASTAALERAFAEHVDACSYRLDAWLLGLVNYQLAAMRYSGRGEEEPARTGLHLGAYGILEDLRPERRSLTPVRLTGGLCKVFERADAPPLLRDSSNGGYIHAPSMNHAVTAAVLRSGYLANATPANPSSLSVNLSSERVRRALLLLEGVRNGQSLGALLGYQLERGLHDRYSLAEVDEFVYALRKEFPLVADRLAPTKTDSNVAIEAIEARNVVDGLRLVEHMKRTGSSAYPFGLELPAASNAQRQAIDAEVDRLLDVHDSVADLALAEGVHQAVQGNFDRVAGTLEAYTRGNYPPEPDVVLTPRSGVTLTHRVGIHLEPGLAAPANAAPRATAEPALDAWLSTVLPALDKVACKVVWKDPATSADAQAIVTFADLGLRPIDLLYLVQADVEHAMTELDDRVLERVVAVAAPRPDAELEIRYMEQIAGKVSVFELAPLVRSLRAVALASRPLRANDITLPNEAAGKAEESVHVDRARIQAVKTRLDTLDGALTAYRAMLAPLLADVTAQRATILAGVDGFLAQAVALLSRAARFGVPQTGWGDLLAWRRREYAGVVERVRGRVARWNERLMRFAAAMADYGALAGAPAGERFAALRRAELEISTAAAPLLATPELLEAAVLLERDAFVTRRNDLVALIGVAASSYADLLGDVAALLPLAAFDPEPFDLAEEEDRAIAFVRDLDAAIDRLQKEVARRSTAAQAALDEHDDAVPLTARARALELAAQALLGEDFRIFPEFDLSVDQGAEWQNAYAASTSGDLLEYLRMDKNVDFPVDEWLYGVARVREKLRRWEEIVMLTGALGRPEPELAPIQLPYAPDDRWLALEFPDGYDLGRDRLLYTALYPSAFDKTKRQCGLLLDEWTEVIPGREETTGIAVNYDRPSSEPAQCMLLVTPATWDGAWQWEDLLGAVEETIELARKRAVEPVHVDATAYARFLPAAVMVATLYGITISLALAMNNEVYALVSEDGDG